MSYDVDAGKGMTHADHLNARLDAEVALQKRPGMRNDELAELLSEDLRSLFWRRQLDVYFAKELRQAP